MITKKLREEPDNSVGIKVPANHKSKRDNMHNELMLISEKGALPIQQGGIIVRSRQLKARSPYVGPAMDYKYGAGNDKQIWVPSNMNYGSVPEGF